MRHMKRFFYLLVILSLLITAVSWISAEGNEEQIQSHLAAARNAIEQNNANTAQSEYEKVLELEPRNFEANLALGKLCSLQNLFSKSVSYLNIAHEVDEERAKNDTTAKKNPEVHYWLGRSKMGLRQFNSAAIEFQFALLDGYTDPEIYVQMSSCYAVSGGKDEAIKWGTKYLKEKGVTQDTASLIVYIYANAGYYPEALAVAQQINDPSIWQSYGMITWGKEAYEQSAVAFQATLKLNGNNDQAYFILGICYYELNQMDEAVSSLKAALKIQPKDPSYLGGLGYVYAEKGSNLAEAEKLCRDALLEANSNADLYDDLGWVLFKRGNIDEAIRNLENAKYLDPKNANVYYHLAYIYKKQNNIAKAKEMLSKTDTLEKQGRRLKKDINDLKKALGM